MKKVQLSLSIQILILCLCLVLVISADNATVLVEKNGFFIVHPDQSCVLEKNIFDGTLSIDKNVVLPDQENVIFHASNYVCSAPVNGTDLYLIFTGSLNSMRKETKMLLWTVLVVVFILALVSADIAIALSYSLTKPFRHFVSTFNAISGGDFTTSTPDYASREASALTTGFNSFADSISGMVRKKEQSAQISGAQAMDTSASEAVTACWDLTESSRSVAEKVSKCNKGANSLTSNSDAVVMIAENTKFAADQLEKFISPFKIRE